MTAAAAIPAVDVRRTVGPRRTACAPAAANSARSDAASPPSGPTITTTSPVDGRGTAASGASASSSSTSASDAEAILLCELDGTNAEVSEYIMATRSITDPKDRLTTILIAPMMTCSARLPVYAVIIAAFIPNTKVGPGIGLQGLVLFCLYVAGIIGAMVVALVLRRSVTKGAASGFIMELPKYQLPTVKDLALGLWQRAWIFLRRAGTMIFTVTIVLWILLNFPRAEPGQERVHHPL